MATIRKRTLPSGKERWQVDFHDQAGKRRAKLFERKKDADAFLVDIRPRIRDGVYVHDSDSITVADAAQAWLDHCAARQKAGRRMERATLRDYQDKVRLHIKDADIGIGRIKLSRLTRKAVNELRDRLLESGRSEHMTKRVLGVLRLILNHAMDNGQIPSNVAHGVKVIRSSRIGHTVRIPTKEEVRCLIDEADDGFSPMLIVSALCGLRASETRGLRWQDVDFEDGLIRVRQRADTYNVIGEPKSAAGRRDIPAGPIVLNTLRRWRLQCPKGNLDLVFPNRDGSVAVHSNILKRRFKPLCRKIGIEMRWHDLRHFAVSLWIEQGFSIKETMSFAGHSSVQMTMERYGHLFPSPDHRQGMAEVEARLFG
jgi:integrase